MQDGANPKQQIVEKLKGSTNILVTVSSNPSVDELSAALALTCILNKMEKHATAVFSGAIPPAIHFLEPKKTFENSVDSLRDFIIALDKEKADRLRYKVDGDMVRIFITPYHASLSEKDLKFSQGDFNVETILALGVEKREELDRAIVAHGRILHDATVLTMNAREGKSSLGAVDWQDADASSLCEMLTGLSEALQPGVIDEQIATALLTGIVAATNRFSNDHTKPRVMTMAAQLMAAGANQQLIATKLENSHTIEPLKDTFKKQNTWKKPEQNDDNEQADESVDTIASNSDDTKLILESNPIDDGSTEDNEEKKAGTDDSASDGAGNYEEDDESEDSDSDDGGVTIGEVQVDHGEKKKDPPKPLDSSTAGLNQLEIEDKKRREATERAEDALAIVNFENSESKAADTTQAAVDAQPSFSDNSGQDNTTPVPVQPDENVAPPLPSLPPMPFDAMNVASPNATPPVEEQNNTLSPLVQNAPPSVDSAAYQPEQAMPATPEDTVSITPPRPFLSGQDAPTNGESDAPFDGGDQPGGDEQLRLTRDRRVQPLGQSSWQAKKVDPPTMGGTLSATSEVALQDKIRSEEKERNLSLLSHERPNASYRQTPTAVTDALSTLDNPAAFSAPSPIPTATAPVAAAEPNSSYQTPTQGNLNPVAQAIEPNMADQLPPVETPALMSDVDGARNAVSAALDIAGLTPAAATTPPAEDFVQTPVPPMPPMPDYEQTTSSPAAPVEPLPPMQTEQWSAAPPPPPDTGTGPLPELSPLPPPPPPMPTDGAYPDISAQPSYDTSPLLPPVDSQSPAPYTPPAPLPDQNAPAVYTPNPNDPAQFKIPGQ